MDRGDRAADRAGEALAGSEVAERDGSAGEVVDDNGARAPDRHLAEDRVHGEGQAPADAGAQRAEGDQLGGGARLGSLAARHPDQHLLAVPRVEDRLFEAAVGAASETASRRDVEPGYGRGGERG